MSKLLARLSDPEKSGVYRVSHERDVREALTGSGHDISWVPLGAGKDAILAAVSAALDFPDWFGGNWDALEDCLTDLSWRRGSGQVILFSQAHEGDEVGILLDVLASAGEYWREQGRPFFAVFVDPAGRMALPALYRDKTA